MTLKIVALNIWKILLDTIQNQNLILRVEGEFILKAISFKNNAKFKLATKIAAIQSRFYVNMYCIHKDGA